MTSFVHIDYSTQHPGVLRAEQAAENLKGLAHRLAGPRAAASLLLAAVVAALAVVTHQVIDTWTDGHLLAAWMVMWAVVFAALALLAAPLRALSLRVKANLTQWAASRRRAADDSKLWSLALTDARVMAELSRAMSSAANVDIRKYY